MKRLFIVLTILFLGVNVNAQEAMTYSKVIEVLGKDAKTLYQNAKTWFATNYQNPKKVIQVDDPSQCMLSAKSNVDYSHGGLSYLSYEGWVEFTILIQCKDGRLRVQVTNLIHTNIPGHASQSKLGLILNMDNQFTSGMQKKFNNNVAADIKEKMQVESDKIFDSLEKFIKSNNSVVNDEW
jgi:hypothetical protein